jgi:hypothetical protein
MREREREREREERENVRERDESTLENTILINYFFYHYCNTFKL